jgi:hypothetical protein
MAPKTQTLYQMKGDFIHDTCAETEQIDKAKLVETALSAVDADDVCAVCGEPALVKDEIEDENATDRPVGEEAP